MLLVNQDRDRTYEYSGQTLYSVPALSPQNDLWGFNLHMEGVNELLGTFDSLEEIQYEMDAINTSDSIEHFISGYSPYDCVEDLESLCAYIDGLSEEEYNHEVNS